MLSSLKGYQVVDSYWYDKVPSHWKKTKNKYVFNQNKHVVGKDWERLTLLTMGKSGVKPRDLDGGGKFPASFENYQTVEPNQLIFCLFDLDETPRTIGISKDYGMITSAYDVFSSTESNDPNFWTYFYQMIDDHKGLRPFYTGLRKVVRSETFMGIEIFSPPLEEQKLISRYLDKKTKQIDMLIDKIQKKIELLKEQRTSIINQCVTKGLNSNVQMKNSGVEWIGNIPSHWKLSKVKFELNFYNNTRIPLSAEERGNCQGEYPYYGSTSLIDWVDDYLFDGRYILIAEDGGNLVLRNLRLSYIVEGKFWVNNHAHILKSKCEVYDHYYCEFLEQSDFTTSISGSAQPKLTLEAIKEIPVCVPPENEIGVITSELKKVVSTFKKLLESHGKKIDLLREYRQSLISSVVMGKVRVTEDII